MTENAADIEDIPRDPEANAVTVSAVSLTENTVIREEEEGETASKVNKYKL